jgi:hypothetical protein
MIGPGVVLLLGLFVTFTASLAANTEAGTPPPVASFSSWDHGFEGPDVLSAGLTTFRLQNRGAVPHQLQLLQLPHDRTPEDLASYLQASHGEVPSWAKHRGGPNGVSPGETADATIYLEPGTYVLTCAIPTKAQPHVMRGMSKILHVVGNHTTQPEFMGHVHMAMFEYEFVVVQRMRSGPQTFYVVTRGTQVHQVSLVRLNPNATAGDMLTAFVPTTTGLSLPGKLLGGMAGLEPGGRGMFSATLAPGRYALICLFPNPAAHDSHAAKGMVINFTVD